MGSRTSDEASGVSRVTQVEGSTGADVAVNAGPVTGEELGSDIGASSLSMMTLAAVTLAVTSVVASSDAVSSEVLPEAPCGDERIVGLSGMKIQLCSSGMKAGCGTSSSTSSVSRVLVVVVASFISALFAGQLSRVPAAFRPTPHTRSTAPARLHRVSE